MRKDRKDRAKFKSAELAILDFLKWLDKDVKVLLNGKLNCPFFFTKNIEKIQHLAFTDKVKIINAYVPEK